MLGYIELVADLIAICSAAYWLFGAVTGKKRK